MLDAVLLNAIMSNVAKVSVVMLNVILLNVVAPLCGVATFEKIDFIFGNVVNDEKMLHTRSSKGMYYKTYCDSN